VSRAIDERNMTEELHGSIAAYLLTWRIIHLVRPICREGLRRQTKVRIRPVCLEINIGLIWDRDSVWMWRFLLVITVKKGRSLNVYRTHPWAIALWITTPENLGVGVTKLNGDITLEF